MCLFTVTGEHRTIIDLSLGPVEGSEFTLDALISHYHYAVKECAKRKGKSYTTVSKTIKHPKTPYSFKLVANCYLNSRGDLTPHSVYLKVKDVHNHVIQFTLDKYMTQQIEQQILGE